MNLKNNNKRDTVNIKLNLKRAGATSLIAIAGATFVGPWEGKRNHSYQDIVGVWTICYGETKGVKRGQYKTDEQCIQSLAVELTEYNQQMHSLIKVQLTPYEEVAYTSFVWNVGLTNFKNSTLLKKLNARDFKGACNEIPRWNRAGGIVSKGLTNRRQAEHKACLGQDERLNKALEEEGLTL